MDHATKQAAEAAEAMAPTTREVTAGGKKYTVKRLVTRQIWPILKIGLPIIEGLVALAGPAVPSPATAGPPLADSGGDKAQPLGALDQLIGRELAAFMRLMANEGERITELVAIALDETTRKVGDFEPQETFLMAKAIVEVNRDFFTHRVAPLLGLDLGAITEAGALGGALGSAFQKLGAGQTPASS